jgi:hypothetical protein
LNRLKLIFTVATVVVCCTACAPVAVTPSPVVSQAAVIPSAVVSPTAVAPSSAAALSPEPSSSQQAATLTVAGTDVIGPPLSLTVTLPSGWESIQGGFGADNGTSSPPSGMAFIVSLVDNTFKDPCAHVQRSPKIGSTVAALATALGEVPNTTATKPVQTTVGGHEATYIELAIPATLPCDPSEFYLWQDSPGGDWWAQGLNETARVWILEVGGRRVAFLAHSYPASGADPKAVFQSILDTVVFQGAS